MALVVVSKGMLARSRLRTVTTHGLAAIAGGLTLAGMIAGFFLGALLNGARPADSGQPAEFIILDPDRPESRALIREIGSLSGRVIRLEALAARLANSVDVVRPANAVTTNAQTEIAREPAGGPLVAASQDGSGTGPALLRLHRGLDDVETRLDQVASRVARNDLDLMAFPSRTPIPGTARTSGFGSRTDPFTRRPARHTGFDYGAAHGTPILASAGGRVRRAGPYGPYGRTVEIDHGDGLVTRYGHLSKVLVRVGDVVLPEQAIATVGSTGRSTGPHLHFEILRDGKPVHPDLYLDSGVH